MINRLLIGILIVLVISMILYVQYHANYSLEKFVDMNNDRFINCSATACTPTDKFTGCPDGTEVIAYVNNSEKLDEFRPRGGAGTREYGKNVCISGFKSDNSNWGKGNTMPQTCATNNYVTVCGNKVSDESFNKDKNYLKQCYYQLYSTAKEVKDSKLMNPNNIMSSTCSQSRPNALEGTTCMISEAGMYDSLPGKILIPCRDNKQIIKGFKGFDCTKTEQTNLLGASTPQNGLTLTYYKLNKQNGNKPGDKIKTVTFNEPIDFNWMDKLILNSGKKDNVYLIFKGYIELGEKRSIRATYDDGVKLIIDGKEIINDLIYQKARTRTINLNNKDINFDDGLVSFELHYFDSSGSASLSLMWSENMNPPYEVIPQKAFFLSK